jgi:hypothetical protein
MNPSKLRGKEEVKKIQPLGRSKRLKDEDLTGLKLLEATWKL